MDKKLRELLLDDSFKSEVEMLDSNEKIKALFAKNGIEVDIEEAVEKELNESNLENVVGGSSNRATYQWFRIGRRWIKILTL